VSDHGMQDGPDEPDPGAAGDPAPHGQGDAAAAGAVVVVRGGKHTARDLGRLLWDHAGRIGVAALLTIAVLSLLFLAIIGFTAALVLLVVLVVGITMIAVGGRIRA